ncbi:hypothetical protein ACO0LF_27305 [Undibacterium sp. Di27W]|uniref:hypothetical protein n=1 Tax=Undibacterium sp. Di27W TaxID=3413036 RepID=UPI003BF0D2C1
MNEQNQINTDLANQAEPASPIQSAASNKLPETAPVVILFMIAHLILTGIYAQYYVDLVRTGQVGALTFLLALLGDMFLYLGGIQNARKSKSSGILWMIATVLLALALPGRDLTFLPDTLILCGCLLALSGWWAVRQAKKVI